MVSAMDAMTAARDHRATQPEVLLLLRAVDGDARAFAALTRMLARPALALAVRVLGDRALAEDAVQEAMTKLWREGRQFDPDRGSFAAWWHRVLMNCALDGRRRLKPVAPLDDAAHLPDDGVSAIEQAEATSLAAHVQRAAAKLPARQRAALALFYADGLSMAEIGDVLETSEKAVEGLLARGREGLRPHLAGLQEELK